MLVTHAECGRGQGDFLVHSRSRPLAVERQVSAAHQCGNQIVWFSQLNLRNRRAEIGYIEWKEGSLDDATATLADIMVDPLCGNLTVIVIRGYDVGLLSPLFHGAIHNRFHGLRGRSAGNDDVAVADPALVEDVIEIKRIGAVECLPDGLSGCRSDAAMHHIDFVPASKLLGELGIQGDIRLGVVLDHFDLPAQQSALFVDFIRGKLCGQHHRLAVYIQVARIVEHRTQLDVVLAKNDTWKTPSYGGDTRSLQNFTP